MAGNVFGYAKGALSSHADDLVTLRLEGVDELKRALKDLPGKLRAKVLQKALSKAGQAISKQAKATAPVLKMPVLYRTPGTLRKRISVRASKFAKQAGDVGVFIGVRPIRGSAQIKRFGRASATNPNDPYYWRFVEFGTVKAKAKPFLRPAADAKAQEAVAIFMREVVPQIEKLNRSKG